MGQAAVGVSALGWLLYRTCRKELSPTSRRVINRPDVLRRPRRQASAKIWESWHVCRDRISPGLGKTRDMSASLDKLALPRWQRARSPLAHDTKFIYNAGMCIYQSRHLALSTFQEHGTRVRIQDLHGIRADTVYSTVRLYKVTHNHRICEHVRIEGGK